MRTSRPIRRYPDLLTHRAIYAILSGKIRAEGAGRFRAEHRAVAARRAMQQADDESRGRSRSNTAIWEELGLHCSANERRADEASRDVEAQVLLHARQARRGVRRDGERRHVVRHLRAARHAVHRRAVHVTELGSDYFQYDEIKNELRGERTGIRYRLSDRVRVQVSRVDLDARKIDFRLVRDTPVKAPRPSPAPASAGGGVDRGNGPRVRTLQVEGSRAAPQEGRECAERCGE